MTVIVAAPEPMAAVVAEALADRTTRTATTIVAARDSLDETTPTAVLVAPSIPDGDASDLLTTVRTGERCSPRTPVIALTGSVNTGRSDTSETDPLDANATRSGDSTTAFDDRVPADDPEAIVEAVSLAVAIGAYRESLDTLYERCRERPVDADRIDSARRDARKHLETLQHLAGDRTPFDRLLSK